MIKNKLILMLWVTFFSHPFFAQNIDKAAMQSDLLYIASTCSEMFLLNNEEQLEIENNTRSIINELPDSLSAFQFFSYCNKVISLFKERHLHLQGTKDDPFFMNEISLFKLDTFWYNTILSSNKSYYRYLDTLLEINEFNSLSFNDLKHIASSYYTSEGDCQSGPVLDMNEQWNYFIQWKLEQPKKFELKLTNDTILKSNGVSLDELKKWHQTKDTLPPVPVVKFSFNKKNQTAYLQLNSFNPKKLKAEVGSFSKYLADIFNYLNKNNTQSLIIDLRNNTGGVNKYADLLLSYLNKYNSKDTLYCIEVKQKKHYVRPYKVKNKYKNDLYILIGPDTYSNASRIASQLQHNNRALLFGSCASGKAQNMWAGKYKSKQLPNSKFQLHIPYYRYYYFNFNQLEPDCLCPNIEVKNNIFTQKDEQLQLVIDIILKKISLKDLESLNLQQN